MGSSTHCAVVPYKIGGKYVNDVLKKLYGQIENDPLSFSGNITYKTWKYCNSVAVKYEDKNKNYLYCDTLEKEDKVLYVINEAQYSAGGDHCNCVFAKNKLDLLELLKDWEIDGEITEDDVVKQTL